MPPPQAIVCHLCNGKYFKRSFPIHLKQCEEKWKKTHSRCEYCGSAVANHDWSDHRSHCKPKRVGRRKKTGNHSKNMPLQVPQNVNQQLIPTLKNSGKIRECEECETEQASWQCLECEQSLCAMCEVDLHRKGARSRHTRIPMNAKALQQENLSIITANDCKEECDDDQNILKVPSIPDANTDPRAQCKFCERRFNPDRVEKHMRICSKHQKKSKRRKIYDGAKRRVEGTVFEEFQYNRSKTPPIVKEWKKNSRRWKEESSQLREIAAISTDLKEMRGAIDKKEEETDIDIKVGKKPVIRKTESMPTISGISSSRNGQKRKVVMKGGTMSRRSRVVNNKDKDLSLQGSSRNMSRRNSTTTKYGKVKEDVGNNKPQRISRRNSMTKKPMIPKFEPKKAVTHKRQSIKNKTFESRSTSNIINKKTNNERKRKSMNMNETTKAKKPEIPKMVESKPKQQRLRKQRSEASSLSRGLDLGMNVKKIFDDKPKTMNDYVERERLRRQQRQNQPRGIKRDNIKRDNIGKSNDYKPKPKPKIQQKDKMPTKRMSRLQIKKEIKIDNQAIGGKRINKPSNSKDLASKRAAYFESLLSSQEQ